MDVRLRPLAPPDVEALYEWSQDETFCRAAGWTLGLTREAMNRFWLPLLATRAEDFVRLGIEQQGQLVGYADLAGIDRAAGAAEFGIAIGPSHRWGQGLGHTAGRLMLRHGFQTLGLTRIWAEVHAPNLC